MITAIIMALGGRKAAAPRGLRQERDEDGPLAGLRAPSLHPVSVRRFPSFRTQPLENLSVDSVKHGFLSNPAPGENLLSGNLVLETGCRRGGGYS